jgi:L-serine dehydratase
MIDAATEGFAGGVPMMGGYAANDYGRRVWRRATSGFAASESLIGKAVGMALAMSELNASVGRIVAAPTAI